MAAKAGKAKKSTQRKLTAILSADVVGYSRLMGENEEAVFSKIHCRLTGLPGLDQPIFRIQPMSNPPDNKQGRSWLPKAN